MGQLTYRNCFLAFFVLYFSTISFSAGAAGANSTEAVDKTSIWLFLGAVVFIAVSIAVWFASFWAVMKAFTGISIRLWDIIWYFMILGYLSFWLLAVLLVITVKAIVPEAGADWAEQGWPAVLAASLLVIALSAGISGLFYRAKSRLSPESGDN